MNSQQLPNIRNWLAECGVDDETAWNKLHAALKPCRFGKKQLLVREGFKSGNAFFLEKGMTRSYWIVDGQEVTTSFSTEGSIVFSMDEVYYNKPSEEYVETIEPVMAFAIPIPTLLSLVHSEPSLSHWWVTIHQNEYRRLHRSHKDRLTLSASERYREFESQFPEVCRRGRLSDIASYLGITPSTLSRLRGAKGRFLDLGQE